MAEHLSMIQLMGVLEDLTSRKETGTLSINADDKHVVTFALDQGRVAALEIMVGTPAISNLIREGKTFQIPSIIQTAKGEGMQLMDQHLSDLLKRKVVTADECYRCAVDKKLFEPLLKKTPAKPPGA